MDRRRATALAAALAVAGMTGLAYAAVPLYDLFCRVTGYGGTPAAAAAAPGAGPGADAVTIRFNADTARGLPWAFRPERPRMTVRTGESALAFYRATNRGDREIVGTATFNVTPAKAGRHFAKIDCFCFEEQRLGPGETADLPVAFFVDPAIREDPSTEEVTTITLSYTFFEAGGTDDGPAAARTAGERPASP